MGPLEAVKPWQTSGIEGVRRFLDRAWTSSPTARCRRTIARLRRRRPSASSTRRSRRSREDIEAHALQHGDQRDDDPRQAPRRAASRSRARPRRRSCCSLSPFAPHLGEELWQRLGAKRVARLRAVAGVRPGARQGRRRRDRRAGNGKARGASSSSPSTPTRPRRALLRSPIRRWRRSSTARRSRRSSTCAAGSSTSSCSAVAGLRLGLGSGGCGYQPVHGHEASPGTAAPAVVSRAGCAPRPAPRAPRPAPRAPRPAPRAPRPARSGRP